MFTKILLAADGSPESARAVALTRHLAIQDGADVEVVHVREFAFGARSPQERAHGHGDDRAEAVRRYRDELEAVGVHTQLTMASSTADGLAAALAERADATGADVMVVGADLHPGFGTASGRSITQQLVQIAPCPVLVVPLRSSVRTDNEATRTAAAAHARLSR
jgi:nucleotide-binding universal stress UspA family protein